MPEQSRRLKVCLVNRPVIINLVDTSHITYPEVNTGIIFSITTLTSFPFVHTFFLSYNIFCFSDIPAFQFFACEGVERPEEGRQSLGWKKTAARKRCLKYVREINNPNKKKKEGKSFCSESGNSPLLFTQKEP